MSVGLTPNLAWVVLLLAGLLEIVWTGIGSVGAAVLGIAFFGQSLSTLRIGCIALIVFGILGLRFLGGESAG